MCYIKSLMGRGKDQQVRKTRSDKHRPDDVVNCRQCGELFLRSSLSTRGLCYECSLLRMTDSIAQLRRKQGPIYDLWVKRRVDGFKAIEAQNDDNGSNGKVELTTPYNLTGCRMGVSGEGGNELKRGDLI